MFAKRSSTFAALALAGVAGGIVLAAPQTTRYKVETRSEQIIDLSAVGQGEQRNVIALVNFLTVTLNDTANGRTVHAVLDSMIKADTSPIPTQGALDSARGRAWHGVMDLDGKLSNVARVDSAGRGGQGGDLISNFFPRVKRGAKVGDNWTDTSETATSEDGQSITTRTVTNYRVTGTENRNGTRALKIETAFSLSQTGEVTNDGGTLGVDGTGTGTATYFVTDDGRYLGGNSTVNSDLQITTPQLPEPIPIKATNTANVTVIN
jgi:hypothetical protein